MLGGYIRDGHPIKRKKNAVFKPVASLVAATHSRRDVLKSGMGDQSGGVQGPPGRAKARQGRNGRERHPREAPRGDKRAIRRSRGEMRSLLRLKEENVRAVNNPPAELPGFNRAR